jgi:hypothetical protein
MQPMRKLTIDLTEEETLELEYRYFEYTGIKIQVDRFLTSDLEYNEDHFSRLVNTLTEKYAQMQGALMKVLKAHGQSNIKMREFEFSILPDSLLIVY